MNKMSEEEIYEYAKFVHELGRLYKETKTDFLKTQIESSLSHSWNEIGCRSKWPHINPLKASEGAIKKLSKLRKEAGLNERELLPIVKIPYNKQIAPLSKNGLGDPKRQREKNAKYLDKTPFFHWEHAVTRKMFTNGVKEIMELDESQQFDAIKKLIKSHQIIWILKIENDQLNDNGYLRERVDGWESAYKKSNIILSDMKNND